MRLSLFLLGFACSTGLAHAQTTPRPTAAVASGVFSAANTVTLAPGVDGRVLAVGAKEGARVAAGTVILRLDDREQRARVALAATAAGSDAEIRMAAIRGGEANARLNGTQTAARTGAATPWEVRQATAAAEQAAMEGRAAQDKRLIEQKRTTLETLVLENFALRAPFSGRITQINARAGTSVRKGQSLVTLVDMSNLRAETFVPARNYGYLKVGKVYDVKFSGPFAAQGKAVLAYIDPVLNAGSFRCVFTMQNAGDKLPAGLEGQIQLDSGRNS